VSLGIFFLVPRQNHVPWGRLGLWKWVPGIFPWSKGGRYVWLTTYHPCSAETSRYSGALNYPEPLGPPRPVEGHHYFFFYFTFYSSSSSNTGGTFTFLTGMCRVHFVSHKNLSVFSSVITFEEIIYSLHAMPMFLPVHLLFKYLSLLDVCTRFQVYCVAHSPHQHVRITCLFMLLS